MIRGLTQEIVRSGSGPEGMVTRQGNSGFDSSSLRATVIGVICAGDLAVHRAKIKEALQRGIEQRPDAVWVCIEPKSDRMTHDVMISLGIEPVVLPMNPHWKSKGGIVKHVWPGVDERWKIGDKLRPVDSRRVIRDAEMLSLCDELIIFHKASGDSPWRGIEKSGLYTDKLVLVELGKEKPKAKKSA